MYDDRCPRCFLRRPRCICAEIPSVRARTRVTIVRHALERNKKSNTGRLAAMALGAELIDWGLQENPRPPLVFGERAYLLFPESSNVLTAPPTEPIHLVVLDGTWPQAKRLAQRVPELRALPRLTLPPPEAIRSRLRRPRREGEMSTLEAIAAALARLDGEEVAAPLDALYDEFVLRSIPANPRGPMRLG